ncbi:MAG: single-stranded DNA-binding protein [Actinomycetota bacterium]
MNHVSIVGNLAADPELRYTQSGKAVANFTVAVSHRTKKDGEWTDVTDGFFNVTAWSSLADNVAKSLRKGARVLVTGKLIQRTFETEEGKRSVVEIQANHVAADLQFATATIEKASLCLGCEVSRQGRSRPKGGPTAAGLCGHAGLRGWQARPAELPGQRRQQTSHRRDPVYPRRPGPSVRHRVGGEGDRG